MNAYVIDVEKIESLRKFAEENRFDVEALMQVKLGHGPAVGDREGFYVLVEGGMKVVFSIEQTLRGGWVRHGSFSVAQAGRLPHPSMVEELLKLLGFEGGMEAGYMYFEDIGEGHQAVNVVERISS